jgi:hypothetical protein
MKTLFSLMFSLLIVFGLQAHDHSPPGKELVSISNQDEMISAVISIVAPVAIQIDALTVLKNDATNYFAVKEERIAYRHRQQSYLLTTNFNRAARLPKRSVDKRGAYSHQRC